MLSGFLFLCLPWCAPESSKYRSAGKGELSLWWRPSCCHCSMAEHCRQPWSLEIRRLSLPSWRRGDWIALQWSMKTRGVTSVLLTEIFCVGTFSEHYWDFWSKHLISTSAFMTIWCHLLRKQWFMMFLTKNLFQIKRTSSTFYSWVSRR